MAPFAAHPVHALRAHPQDGHFSPLGYRLLAESITAYMRANLSVFHATMSEALE